MKKSLHLSTWFFAIVILLIPLFHLKEYYFGMSVPKALIFRFLIPIWVIYFIIIKQQITLKISSIFLVFTAYISIQIILSFFSINIADTWFSGFERMYGVIDEILLWLLFILIIQYSEFIIDKQLFLWRIFSVVSLIISLFGIYQHFQNPDIRAESTLSNPVYFGFFVQVSILAHIYLLDKQIHIFKSKFISVFYLLLCIISLFLAGLYSGTRSFILALGIGLIVYFVLSIKQYSKKKLLYISLALLAVLVGLGIYIKFNTQISIRSFDFQGTDSSSKARFTLWHMFLDNWQNVPFFGLGRNQVQTFVCQNYPAELFNSGIWYDKLHNGFLDKWVETGLLGFLVYVGFWGLILFQVFFKTKSNSLRPLIAAFLCSYVVFLNTTFEFLYSQIIFVFALAFISINSKSKDFVLDLALSKKAIFAFILSTVIFLNYTSYSAYSEWNKTLKIWDLDQFLISYNRAFEKSIFEKKDIAIEFALQRKRVQDLEVEKKIYLSKTEQMLKECLSTQESDPVLMSQLGFVLFESGKKEEAILQYEELRKLAPNRIINLLDLAIFNANIGKFTSSNEILDHVKVLNPSDFTADYYKAYNYSLMAKKDSTFLVLNKIPESFRANKVELLEAIFSNLKIENEYISYLKSMEFKYFRAKNYQSWLKFAINQKNIDEIKISLYSYGRHYIPVEHEHLRIEFENLILTGQADYTQMPQYFKGFWYDS